MKSKYIQNTKRIYIDEAAHINLKDIELNLTALKENTKKKNLDLLLLTVSRTQSKCSGSHNNPF